MKKFSFSDNDLRSAAARAEEIMLKQYDNLNDYTYTFSDPFNEKMAELIRRVNRRTKMTAFAKQVAAVFAAMLIGLASWIAVDTDARAAFFEWTREVYENSVVYKYFGGNKPGSVSRRRLTWMPDGFEVIVSRYDELSSVVYYANPDTGDVIGFEYRYLDEGKQLEVNAGDENLTCETIVLDGLTIEYYPISSDLVTNNMIWIDEDEKIIFVLNSTMDKTTMLKIIENIQ